jgi:hypothetical protein
VAQYYLLDALGCHAASSGQARLPAQLLRAAETIRTGAGATVIPTIAPLLAHAERSAIAVLGASGSESEFKTEERLSRDAALGLAKCEPRQVAAPGSGGASAEVLGKRETEVARSPNH